MKSVTGKGWRFRDHDGVSSATFSPCGQFRYELRRVWKPKARAMVFVGLNPSTADESTDDPTIRRILGFADDWGFGTLVMLNAFAYRSTDPKALHTRASCSREVIGPENDPTMRRTFETHRRDKLVIGWGAHGILLERGRDVASIALSVHSRPECFGLTQNGQPKHPLYLAASTKAQRYAAPPKTRT
ncbi:MAG: hypothetical protein JWP87_2142 [Labilithrix sp.]|nr:hypothetical protein [Labilithrix sp.]